MGLYLNQGNTVFEMSRFSGLYIDKSMLIAKINAIYKSELKSKNSIKKIKFRKEAGYEYTSAMLRYCDLIIDMVFFIKTENIGA